MVYHHGREKIERFWGEIMKQLIIEYPGSELGAVGKITLNVEIAFKAFNIATTKKIIKMILQHCSTLTIEMLISELNNQKQAMDDLIMSNKKTLKDTIFVYERLNPKAKKESKLAGSIRSLGANIKRTKRLKENYRRYIDWLENRKVT